MPSYHVQTLDQNGRLHQGKQQASSKKALRLFLQQQGIALLKCRRIYQTPVSFVSESTLRSQRLLFCWHMHYILNAGLSLLAGLESFAQELKRGGSKRIILSLIVAIKKGGTLSETLSKFPKMFDPLFITLIRIAERTGDLSTSFHNLALHLGWQYNLKRQTKQLLIYPLFLSLFLLVLSWFMLTYLVPELYKMMELLSPDAAEKMAGVYQVSLFVTAYGPLVLTSLFALFCLIFLLYKTCAFIAIKGDQFLFYIPIWGRLNRKIQYAQFTQSLFCLVHGKLTLPHILELLQDYGHNKYIQACLKKASKRVQEGQSFAAAIEAINFSPPTMIVLLKAAEKSGSLMDTTQQLKTFYNQDMRRAIEGVLKLLPPAIMGAVGGILILLICLVFYPLYDSLVMVQWI